METTTTAEEEQGMATPLLMEEREREGATAAAAAAGVGMVAASSGVGGEEKKATTTTTGTAGSGGARMEVVKGVPSRFGAVAKVGLGEKEIQDPQMAAAAGMAACTGLCCCLMFGCLIAGSILVVYGDGKDQGVSDTVLAGRILLVIFATIFACVILCSCSVCCMSNNKGLDDPDNRYNNPKSSKEPKYLFKRLNDHYKVDIRLHNSLLENTAKPLSENVKKLLTEYQKAEKKKKQGLEETIGKEIENDVTSLLAEEGITKEKIVGKLRPKVYVIEFTGDVQASELSELTEKISLILLVCNRSDQVVIILNSPGGMVSEYGLVASQLLRLKKYGLRLTACVDTVAASGGYMAACVADKIIAAPFSFVGSIGVIAYIPNFQRVLDKHEIDVFTFTSGKWKRTVDIVGAVTEEAKEKLKEELDLIYTAFKNHVKNNRPQINDIELVSTGEAWLAQDALKLGLIDEIGTSDELIFDLTLTCDVLKVVRYKKDSSFMDAFSELEDLGITSTRETSKNNKSICSKFSNMLIEKGKNLFLTQQQLFPGAILFQSGQGKVHMV